MYKILFTYALAQEGKIVKNEIKKINSSSVDISFFEHGLGNYNTILNLTKYLSENTYDFIVNIGVCGHNLEKPESLIQVARSENIANRREIIFPIVLAFAPLQSIACSEIPVYDGELLGENSYVDMESYGFEKVCENFQVARISLKVPVDRVGIETENFDREKAQKLLKNNIDYPTLIEKIEKYCKNIPKKHDISKYLEHYQFTFSEKIIFEKWYHKFISLFIGENFDDFFQEHSKENKKKFLEILKNKLAEYKI